MLHGLGRRKINMTTLAWDGKVLAADGRVTVQGALCTDSKPKIIMLNDVELRGSEVICFAYAGDSSVVKLLEEWIKEECPADHLPMGLMYGCLIITRDAAYHACTDQADLYELSEDEPGFEGSGAEFAHAALVMGQNAKDAVKTACKIDVCSGGRISYVNCRVKEPKLKFLDAVV
jgi:hypothetical protein